MKCPHKKASKKEPAVATTGDSLDSKFELDFTLITCMESTVMGSMWYLDSGASFHVMENRDLFSDLEGKDLKKNREFGDDVRYSMTNIDTVTFHRESDSPLRLTYVMYVSELKNSLVSITVLEDHGYDVIFSKGKVFLRHVSTGQVKEINVRVKNLYALKVEDACKYLRIKAKLRDLVVEREHELPLNM